MIRKALHQTFMIFAKWKTVLGNQLLGLKAAMSFAFEKHLARKSRQILIGCIALATCCCIRTRYIYWENIIATFSPFIALSVTIYIAYMQYRLQEQINIVESERLRLELFDKRYRVYIKVQDLLLKIIIFWIPKDSVVPQEIRICFFEVKEEARFLFDNEIVDHIDEIFQKYKKMLELEKEGKTKYKEMEVMQNLIAKAHEKDTDEIFQKKMLELEKEGETKYKEMEAIQTWLTEAHQQKTAELFRKNIGIYYNRNFF